MSRAEVIANYMFKNGFLTSTEIQNALGFSRSETHSSISTIKRSPDKYDLEITGPNKNQLYRVLRIGSESIISTEQTLWRLALFNRPKAKRIINESELSKQLSA